MQFLQHNLHTVFAHNLHTICTQFAHYFCTPICGLCCTKTLPFFGIKMQKIKHKMERLRTQKQTIFKQEINPFERGTNLIRMKNKSYSNGSLSWGRNKPLFLKNKPHFQGKVPHIEENVPLMLRKFWRCRNIHRYFHPTSGFGRTCNLSPMQNGFALGNTQPANDALLICP